MSRLVAGLRSLAGNRLLIVIGVLALLGGVFTAGIVWSSLSHVEQRRAYRAAMDETERLGRVNAELERENETLKSRFAATQRQLQVNQIAYDKLTGELSDSSSYINELREDLDFYQSIISPRDNQAGVRIQGFSVRRDASGPGYEYRLTVVQALDHDKSVTGEATVHIEGMHQSVPIRLSMLDIGDPPAALSFRYFQVVRGRFHLPEGFEPSRAVVKLVTTPAGKGKRTESEQLFDWAVTES